jgi:hypothetical protein
LPVWDGCEIKSIGCGTNHALAIAESDGTVYGWGENALGQVNGTQGPNVQNPVKVPVLIDMTQVTGAIESSIGIDVDGNVWTWGGNGGYELGVDLGLGLPISEPVQVPGLVAFDVASGSCLGHFNVVLTNQGEGNRSRIYLQRTR